MRAGRMKMVYVVCAVIAIGLVVSAVAEMTGSHYGFGYFAFLTVTFALMIGLMIPSICPTPLGWDDMRELAVDA